MGRIIEGVWDCAYCGAKKVRGGLRECPQCGHPRDENVTFYIDNPKNYVYDEAAAAKARRGPDWICPSCDCLNSVDATICVGCGTPRDSHTKDYFQNKRERDSTYQQVEKSWEAFHPEYTPPTFREPDPPQQKSWFQKIKWKPILLTLLIVAILGGMIGGMVALLTPHEVNGVVTDMDWSRSIEIEEYRTVQEEGWSIPAGGREVSRRQEIHHYDQVLDHYETKTRTYTEQVLDHYEEYVTGYRDLGNGHFEEITAQRPVYRTETRTETYQEPVYKSVPIYQTKYTYDIDKWVHDRYEKTSEHDNAPYWAEFTLDTKEREGSRTEQYNIVVKDDEGKERTFHLSLEQWQTLEVGQTVKLMANAFGDAELVIDDQVATEVTSSG